MTLWWNQLRGGRRRKLLVGAPQQLPTSRKPPSLPNSWNRRQNWSSMKKRGEPEENLPKRLRKSWWRVSIFNPATRRKKSKKLKILSLNRIIWKKNFSIWRLRKLTKTKMLKCTNKKSQKWLSSISSKKKGCLSISRRRAPIREVSRKLPSKNKAPQLASLLKGRPQIQTNREKNWRSKINKFNKIKKRTRSISKTKA